MSTTKAFSYDSARDHIVARAAKTETNFSDFVRRAIVAYKTDDNKDTTVAEELAAIKEILSRILVALENGIIPVKVDDIEIESEDSDWAMYKEIESQI